MFVKFQGGAFLPTPVVIFHSQDGSDRFTKEIKQKRRIFICAFLFAFLRVEIRVFAQSWTALFRALSSQQPSAYLNSYFLTWFVGYSTRFISLAIACLSFSETFQISSTILQYNCRNSNSIYNKVSAIVLDWSWPLLNPAVPDIFYFKYHIRVSLIIIFIRYPDVSMQ